MSEHDHRTVKIESLMFLYSHHHEINL